MGVRYDQLGANVEPARGQIGWEPGRGQRTNYGRDTRTGENAKSTAHKATRVTWMVTRTSRERVTGTLSRDSCYSQACGTMGKWKKKARTLLSRKAVCSVSNHCR